MCSALSSASLVFSSNIHLFDFILIELTLKQVMFSPGFRSVMHFCVQLIQIKNQTTVFCCDDSYLKIDLFCLDLSASLACFKLTAAVIAVIPFNPSRLPY